MKVILLQDIARMGRKHDVKEVPDGHAHNYLIPRKLAVPATPQNLKRQHEHQARKEAEGAVAVASFAQFLTRAAAAPIIITASANEQGHLFKGLRAADIAKAIADATGISIEASAIELGRPIKEVGEHSILITRANQQGKVVIIVKAN